MNEISDFLLATAGGRSVGIRLADVIEVADLGAVHQVPGTEPSLRGVTWARGTLMPVFHLGALLSGGPHPAHQSELALVAELNGSPICFEVDAVDVMTRGELLPVPSGETLPWASAVVRRDDGLVPILNLNALRDRLAEAGTRA
ncbi:MAG: chemotaxis protein CheW [Gemmatimonadota bacterium]